MRLLRLFLLLLVFLRGFGSSSRRHGKKVPEVS